MNKLSKRLEVVASFVNDNSKKTNFLTLIKNKAPEIIRFSRAC